MARLFIVLRTKHLRKDSDFIVMKKMYGFWKSLPISQSLLLSD